MKQAAVIFATIGFFVVAIVGTLSGVPPHVCSLRAVVGAFALYVLVRIAGGVVVRVVADAAVRTMTAQAPKDKRDDHAE